MSKINKKNDQATVVPGADLVAGIVLDFRKELTDLIKDGCKKIRIDLGNVGMIDSSGIGVLISAQNSLKKINGTLSVFNISPDILKMFKIMRLDKHFEVAEKG